MWSRRSRRSEPIKTLRVAFCHGDRGAVRYEAHTLLLTLQHNKLMTIIATSARISICILTRPERRPQDKK
ncbi:hypothetical protein BH18ACI4_BH18ACI4_17360 [soil metagenome]